MLKIVANTTNGNMLEEHILDIPACCPVSKNPRPGSKLIIRYYPCGHSLEIASLMAFLHSFRGGLHVNGQLEVRDMEGMIERITQECVQALEIPVTVEACLHVLPRQEMHLMIKGEPMYEGEKIC